MFSNRRTSRSRPPFRRLGGFWLVLFAVTLATIAIVLALLQATSLTSRLMAEAQRRGDKIARQARQTFSRRLKSTLRRVAHDRRFLPKDLWQPFPEIPSWIDGLYVWDGQHLSVLRVPSEASDEIEAVIRARLAMRPLDSPDAGRGEKIEILYDRLGTIPLVLACLGSKLADGSPVIVAARVNHLRLKTDLIEPLLAPGDGLEVVSAAAAGTLRARRLDGAMRFWAVQPTEAFRREQTGTVIGQTLAYVGLTLLALVTLLAASWFLVRAARREMALAEMKAHFVANVSHELKTPLALIRMFGETLESGRVTSEEKRQEYYSIIARESARLAHLIDNILDFSRINAARQEYHYTVIDVADVVRETYEAYRPELEYKKFTHSLRIAEDLPPIHADRDAVSQALVNLMGNAVKYSDDERFLAIEVTTDTRRNRRGVLISVHDRGIGVAPEDRRHLFDGFFRAEDERVRRRRGTGLGLTLLKHMVDSHGGALDVESRLVKGTTFRIFLPAADDEDRIGSAADAGDADVVDALIDGTGDSTA